MKRPALCACCSGISYVQCCGPFHRGEREAPDPVSLMRSRYSAFAIREVEYLYRTLHEDHEDRGAPRELVLRALREAASTQKYLGLKVIDADGVSRDGLGRVLFHAVIFERGRDRSFVELSEFSHDGVGWRYVSGESRRLASRGVAPGSIEEFVSAERALGVGQRE